MGSIIDECHQVCPPFWTLKFYFSSVPNKLLLYIILFFINYRQKKYLSFKNKAINDHQLITSFIYNQVYISLLSNQMENQYLQKREYFSLIQKVGSWNKYQCYLFFILSTISVLQALLIFTAPYLFYISAYQCAATTNEHCTNYVCSLPQQSRAAFKTHSPFNSLADDLGVDFNCQFSSTITMYSTLIFVASASGMLLFSIFTQKLGRRNSLILSLFLLLFGLLLIWVSGLIKSMTAVIFSIFLIFWGADNSYQCIYSFASEVVSQKYRICYINLLNVSYSLAIILNAVLFFWIKDWKVIYLVFMCLPTAVAIVGVLSFVEKTPIDLLSSQSQEQILKKLQNIAEVNSLPFTVTYEQVKQLKHNYASMSKGYSFSVFDILRFKSLRSSLLPLMALHFVNNYLFYSPSVIRRDEQPSLFERSVAQGLSELVSVFITYLALERFKRRHILYLINVMMLLLAIILRLQIQTPTNYVYLSAYFIYRMLISVAFSCSYTMNYEFFPTQIRTAGCNLVALFAMQAGMVQPVITSMLKKNETNQIDQFIAIQLLGFIPVLFIKQTFNTPPPEVIEELAQTK